MNKSTIHIIPYQPEYEDALAELERQSPQGSWIQLELLRDHFLSRADVFDQYAGYLALGSQGEVIGASVVAIADVKINGKALRSGIVFDARVAASHRNQGIAKQLLVHIWEHFFIPNGIEHIFTTMKFSNKAVEKVGAVLQIPAHSYQFFYLTIPTYKRLKTPVHGEVSQRLIIKLGRSKKNLDSYIKKMEDGLTIWKTYSMYRLRLQKVHFLIRQGVKLINLFLPARKRLPNQGKEIRFGFICGMKAENIMGVNDALAELEKDGIDYLSICCEKDDAVYRSLKPLAMNVYPYVLLSSFQVAASDSLEIDVRCF